MTEIPGSRRPGDAGIGLVEVVITMFLLSLIAMAFLPFLLNSTVAASTNAGRATANQLVNQAMDSLRTDLAPADRDCAWVTDWVDDLDGQTTVSGAKTLTMNSTVPACPATPPGSATVAFSVTDQTGAVLAQVTTLVYVIP